VQGIFRVVAMRLLQSRAMDVLLALASAQSLHLIVGKSYEGVQMAFGTEQVAMLADLVPPSR
jgi:hypothetical protein